MAWCVSLGRMRSLVGSCRVAHDVERKAVMEGACAALRMLERACVRRPEQRARAARQLVRAARVAIARGDFRRAQTLLDLLEALARDGTLGAGGARLYDAFVHFVWWVASRGAPYARQAMEALSMVRSTVPLPFSDAQHALCLELGKLVKAGLTVPNSSSSCNSFAGAAAATVAGSGEDGGCEAMVAAGGSDCAGGIGSDGGGVGGGAAAGGGGGVSGAPSRESEVAQTALAESALRAMVRVVQNASARCVRAYLPANCFRAGLPAALRACASASESARAEGEAALRALARAAPDARPADFVQPLLGSLLAGGALERPGAPARMAHAALAAVGAAAPPVVLFAALRAVRAFFWSRHRRCVARRYCDGELAAEADLRDVCACVGGAVLAALRGLRSSPSPPDVDAVLLQQAAMTLALETQVAVREAGAAGDALFGEMLAEILPLSEKLYREPPRVSPEDTVAAAFKKLLPWLPPEEVLRAALAHGGGIADIAGARLHGAAERVADAEFVGMEWEERSSALSMQERDQRSTSAESVEWQHSDDEALLRKARSLYYHLVAPSPDADACPSPRVPRRRPPSVTSPAPASPARAPAKETSGPSDEATLHTEHRVSPPRPAHAPPRRHKRRRTQAHHVSTSETSPLPSPAPFEPAARRQPREEIEESCVEYSQTHDTHKYIPQKLMPEAVSIVARKGCLLSLTDKPCAGCMAVVNEMQHQLPQGNKKSKASEEDYTWANIQQELIWAEITKQASELQGSESKDIGPERLVDWDSNWSSIPDFK